MNFRIDTLGKKLGLGYLLITLVLVATVLITVNQVRNVNSTTDRIVNLRVPSVRASLQVMNGVNHSVAALRGYMLLNDQTFKSERQEAWNDEINTSMLEMESFTTALKDTGFGRRLTKLKLLLKQLSDVQDRVEILSISDKQEAFRLMSTESVEIVFNIRAAIKEIGDNQETLKRADFNNINREITLLSNLEWTLLAVGIIISGLLAYFVSRSITAPVVAAVGVAQNIGSGDLKTDVNVGGTKELKQLGTALINMRDSLLAKTQATERYDWLNSGQNKLNKLMRGDKDTTELARDVVTFIAEYTEANIGAVYLSDDDNSTYRLTATYAFGSEKTRELFKFGEGLIGQVAQDRQTISLEGIDETNIRVMSSLLDAPPKNILVAPFLFEDKVLGIIELGKFTTFNNDQKEFIESNMESVGIFMNSAESRRKIGSLLEETQRQSEELQQQQEELEQSNEELEEQAEKLKEQQEELQASNEELEEQTQVVEQKNRDLEAARLDIDLKARQLEISSKYKSEFLANMSHELRTPLNSLLILSKDLTNNKEQNLSDDQVESLEIISKSGYDLLNLINEILDLSKVEAGKMDLNIQDVVVKDVADDISRNFKAVAKEKGVKLEVSVSNTLPAVIRTDRQRLDQILKNLLSNSLKFTERGTVSVHFERDAGDHFIVKVSDTGIGIPTDKLDVIFEAFQQAEGGTTRKYGGTGLGLSISRALTKLLGGRLTVESELNKGSVFSLIIPLKQTQAGVTEPIRSVDQIDTITNQDDKFLNYPTIEDQREQIKEDDQVILIIEDDQRFAKILADQAKNKDFKYLCAGTGEDGLRLAAQYLPNAIILDIDLPGINGNIVLQELKGNPGLRHIPVHIMSVNEKQLDPIRSGAVEYLTKPLTKEQLDGAFGRIEDHVNRKMKTLLIVDDNEALRKSIVKLIGNSDVKCLQAATAGDALKIMSSEVIDCMVVDIGLPDVSGFELIKQIEKKYTDKVPPIIVYTGKELTRKENDELQQYAETIIIKGVKSEERLLDETALFLHRTVGNLPKNKQQMITDLYNTESIFIGKKVLLVDDDMRNIFALSKVLKERGVDIIKAENGKVALEALANNSNIDIVLMDIMMPEMDGYECMEEIRKNKEWKKIPIIALTAKAMKEDRQKCIDAGANDYITKPVDVERLLSLMRIWISK